MKQHPISKRYFPPMSSEELVAYEQSLLDVGQLEDIITFEEMVLDGFHKYEILVKHKKTPRLRKYEGPSALDYVVSKLQGRHLKRSQITAIAALWCLDHKIDPIKNMLELNNKRKIEGIKYAPRGHAKPTSFRCNTTSYKASDIFCVGQASISKCISIKRHAKDVFEKIFNGEITVNSGYNLYREKFPGVLNGFRDETLVNLRVSKDEIKIPSCFASYEELNVFTRTMCQHGWIRESREKWDEDLETMQYASNWYGNGYPSLCNNWSSVRWEPELRRSVIVSATERLNKLTLKKVAA